MQARETANTEAELAGAQAKLAKLQKSGVAVAATSCITAAGLVVAESVAAGAANTQLSPMRDAAVAVRWPAASAGEPHTMNTVGCQANEPIGCSHVDGSERSASRTVKMHRPRQQWRWLILSCAARPRVEPWYDYE